MDAAGRTAIKERYGVQEEGERHIEAIVFWLDAFQLLIF
jgi:hypothetical protein